MIEESISAVQDAEARAAAVVAEAQERAKDIRRAAETQAEEIEAKAKAQARKLRQDAEAAWRSDEAKALEAAQNVTGEDAEGFDHPSVERMRKAVEAAKAIALSGVGQGA